LFISHLSLPETSCVQARVDNAGMTSEEVADMPGELQESGSSSASDKGKLSPAGKKSNQLK
jgi:hypothetical protein